MPRHSVRELPVAVFRARLIEQSLFFDTEDRYTVLSIVLRQLRKKSYGAFEDTRHNTYDKLRRRKYKNQTLHRSLDHAVVKSVGYRRDRPGKDRSEHRF